MKPLVDLLGELRELLPGKPGPNSESDRTLILHLTDGMEMLADELDYRIRTDDIAISLADGDYEYDLPGEALSVLWVKWNDQPLTANSVLNWERDRNNWRTATSGTPQQFAILGRRLLLSPPASAASIATDGYLSITYIEAPELNALGMPGLSDRDQKIAVYHAALLYCASFEPKTEQEAAGVQLKVQTYGGLLAQALKRAKARHLHPIRDYQPRMRIVTPFRGAAR